MADDQKYINKAKSLFDNLEVFLMGKRKLIKELYIDVHCKREVNNAASVEDFVDFYMRTTNEIDHFTWGDVLASRVFISIVSHYPSLDIKITKDETAKNIYRILVSFSSLDTVGINLPLADEPLPIPERRSIMIVPDDGQPKLIGVSTYTMRKALDLFKFPPNHPITNAAYAMVDVYPNHYVPLASFHEHYKQTKYAAFIELCASLGAKEICIESAEINEQILDVNTDIKTPLAKLGLGINVRENHETGQKIVFKFSEANRNIKGFDSPWLYTEPSWMSMNNLRRNNHLSELGAEFTCLDDMGINANLSLKLLGVGINIGGNFKEMTKIRLSYSVIFWE
jgi:hypothetical protein